MKHLKTFEERYLSDEEIAAGYENMRITEFTVYRLFDDGGATGGIEIEFEDPNAEDPDYKFNTKYDNWIKYDSGPKIAFDNWYPEKTNKILKDYIEKGIEEYKLNNQTDKYNL